MALGFFPTVCMYIVRKSGWLGLCRTLLHIQYPAFKQSTIRLMCAQIPVGECTCSFCSVVCLAWMPRQVWWELVWLGWSGCVASSHFIWLVEPCSVAEQFMMDWCWPSSKTIRLNWDKMSRPKGPPNPPQTLQTMERAGILVLTLFLQGAEDVHEFFANALHGDHSQLSGFKGRRPEGSAWKWQALVCVGRLAKKGGIQSKKQCVEDYISSLGLFRLSGQMRVNLKNTLRGPFYPFTPNDVGWCAECCVALDGRVGLKVSHSELPPATQVLEVISGKLIYGCSCWQLSVFKYDTKCEQHAWLIWCFFGFIHCVLTCFILPTMSPFFECRNLNPKLERMNCHMMRLESLMSPMLLLFTCKFCSAIWFLL